MIKNISKVAETVRNINYLRIPVTRFDMNIEGLNKFNETYFEIKEHCQDFSKIVRAPRNGISISKKNFRPHMWDVRALKSCVEVTVIDGDNGMFRAQLRTGKIDYESKIWGRTAFHKFKEICEKHNIDLDKFKINNGEEIKATIESPIIDFEKNYYQGITFEHVYHLDLNSSYMSGIALAFPKLKPAIEEIFEERKLIKEKKLNKIELTKEEEDKNELLKAILTHTYGFMQSSQINYEYAHMSKAANEFNNKKIREIREKLISQGFKPILYNTDGIWYTHPDNKIYHDEDEGLNLGQWCNDHLDCKFEAISKGKYHFIENDKCKTVIRGRTRKDEIKDRDDWTWDDLYDTTGVEILYIEFNEEKGASYYYA